MKRGFPHLSSLHNLYREQCWDITYHWVCHIMRNKADMLFKLLRFSDHLLDNQIFLSSFPSQVDYVLTVCAYLYIFSFLICTLFKYSNLLLISDFSFRYLNRSLHSINIDERSMTTS